MPDSSLCQIILSHASLVLLLSASTPVVHGDVLVQPLVSSPWWQGQAPSQCLGSYLIDTVSAVMVARAAAGAPESSFA